MKIGINLKILIICIAISSFLITVGIVSYDFGVIAMAVFLSTFVISAPQFFLMYERYRTLKEMETKFPLFLRDMIESIRSGMPFHQSVLITSRLEYGKLSKEIRKMANQISWGIPFDKVVEQFAERIKDSKRLNIALKTIRESYMSGGDVVSTLESVSDTTVILDESEKERRSLLNQYVVLMYGICFLFLGIVVAINRLMIPIFQISAVPGATEALGIENPCNACAGFSCSVCGGFQSVCLMYGMDAEGISCYYTSLFFFMSIIEAICCGLVAGQISENSITSGIKHSIVMSAVIFGAFFLLIYLGLMGV